MAVTLYQFEHSPYCIPIAQVLQACKVSWTPVQVPYATRKIVIELTKGAYYNVPVIDHDGRVVYESAPDTQDIARYIDKTFAGGRLFPPSLNAIQGRLNPYFENDLEGDTFRLVDPKLIPEIPDLVERVELVRFKERKFGRGCIAAWAKDADAIRAEVARKLAPFEKMVKFAPFLTGNQPVYADFLLFGVLGNYTYRGYNTLPAETPSLRAWLDRVRGFTFG